MDLHKFSYVGDYFRLCKLSVQGGVLFFQGGDLGFCFFESILFFALKGLFFFL